VRFLSEVDSLTCVTMSITRSDCTDGVSNQLDKIPDKLGMRDTSNQEHECSLGGAIHMEQ